MFYNDRAGFKPAPTKSQLPFNTMMLVYYWQLRPESMQGRGFQECHRILAREDEGSTFSFTLAVAETADVPFASAGSEADWISPQARVRDT